MSVANFLIKRFMYYSITGQKANGGANKINWLLMYSRFNFYNDEPSLSETQYFLNSFFSYLFLRGHPQLPAT